MRDAILNRADAFVATFTESLLTYALGRRVEHYDMPAVRTIARGAAGNEYRMSSFILGVVGSPPFRMGTADRTLSETVAAPGPAVFENEEN